MTLTPLMSDHLLLRHAAVCGLSCQLRPLLHQLQEALTLMMCSPLPQPGAAEYGHRHLQLTPRHQLQAVLTLLLCVPLLQHGAAQSSHFRQQHQLRHQLQAALTPLIHAPAMQPRAVECGRAGVFLQMSLPPRQRGCSHGKLLWGSNREAPKDKTDSGRSGRCNCVTVQK
jgi:hypothetical protein